MAFFENERNGVVFMTSDKIGARHAFSTRYGGVSGGIFESLNLATARGDDEEAVRENYRRLSRASGIDLDRCAFTRQVHGGEVRIASPGDVHELFTEVPYEADGLVTRERGLALICFTADCVPLLMHDAENGVIAAVHCGWRPTAADIMRAAVEKMKSLGAQPEKITAAAGPAIGACCFEVGEEVIEAMRTLLGGEYPLWREEPGVPGKFLLDLRGVVRERLRQLGVPAENIDISDECTVCRCDKYWSHRATHGRRGTQAAAIVLV